MKQYKKLLSDILAHGTWKEPARENMPRTKSLFGTRMEFDMQDGFPLLTTKKMYYGGIITELLWFLKGDTNIKYLVDNGCNIWNQDAYRWYLKFAEQNQGREQNSILFKNSDGSFRAYQLDEFIGAIKDSNLGSFEYKYNTYYKLGDLGSVYGKQWRNQGGVDQLKTVIDKLKSDPMGRYAIIDAWNPSEFSEMALPPCHLLYQFNCREIPFWDRVNMLYVKGAISTSGDLELVRAELDEVNIPKYYLDLQMYQRSCDTFLGVPFNVASASLLLHLIAKVVNMVPSKFVWVGGDTHIYENHLEQVEEQLSRDCLSLSELKINKDLDSLEDLVNLSKEDIEIVNYKSHSAIKGELKTGL